MIAVMLVITVRLRRQVLVVGVHLLTFVLCVMCVIVVVGMIMIMRALHMSVRMFMVTNLYLGVVVVMFMVITSSWTGSSGVLAAPCGNLFCVWMVGAGLVAWMPMPMSVTLAMAFAGG